MLNIVLQGNVDLEGVTKTNEIQEDTKEAYGYSLEGKRESRLAHNQPDVIEKKALQKKKAFGQRKAHSMVADFKFGVQAQGRKQEEQEGEK